MSMSSEKLTIMQNIVNNITNKIHPVLIKKLSITWQAVSCGENSSDSVACPCLTLELQTGEEIKETVTPTNRAQALEM